MKEQNLELLHLLTAITLTQSLLEKAPYVEIKVVCLRRLQWLKSISRQSLPDELPRIKGWANKILMLITLYSNSEGKDRTGDMLAQTDATIEFLDNELEECDEREILRQLGLPYKLKHGFGVIDGGKS